MAHHWTFAVVHLHMNTTKFVSRMWHCRALASKGLREFERAYEEREMALVKDIDNQEFVAEIAALSDLLGLRKPEVVAIQGILVVRSRRKCKINSPNGNRLDQRTLPISKVCSPKNTKLSLFCPSSGPPQGIHLPSSSHELCTSARLPSLTSCHSLSRLPPEATALVLCFHCRLHRVTQTLLSTICFPAVVRWHVLF